jgi:hypothetical protein
VGEPVGPMRTTGSPGLSNTHRSEDPPISSTIVETNPLSGRPRRRSEPVLPSPGSSRSVVVARVSKFCRR